MNPNAPQAEPRAYSYIRFSTPSQAHGDSQARQTDRASLYAAEKGLVLDTELTLTDLGVSGYRGKNAKTGALGAFLKAAEDRRVPKGSYLLVENLDRLSRDEINEAMPLFMQIINAGVVLVTLTSGEVYSKQRLRKEPHVMFLVLNELLRSHQESFYKGQRVADAKERNRGRLVRGELTGRPYTRQTPGWIRWSDETKAYELIPDRVAVLREIFDLADKGWSPDRIARDLNRREIETWGGRRGQRKATHWRGSYLRKIMATKAPIGFFTPTKSTRDEDTGARRDIPAADPVFLWPPAVDEDTYWRVARRFETTAPRGKNAGREPVSLLAGVAKCTCGSTVLRVSKGPRRSKHYAYLICARVHEKAKGCNSPRVRYDDVVEALTVNAEAIVLHAPGGKDTADIEKEINGLQGYVDNLEWEVEQLADLAANERSPAASKRFREKERELEKRRKELRELRARKDTLTPVSVSTRLQELQGVLTRTPLNVAKGNAALRQTIRKIVIDPKRAMLTLHWHHSDETEDVPFYSRHKVWENEETPAPA